VIAANRDEFLDRPSEGPALRTTPHGVVVAPQDLRAGGTWLGMNGVNVFAALTNRPCKAPDPGRRSRGLLVMDALRWRSAGEAADELATSISRPDAYNPFNLLIADPVGAFLISYDGKAVCTELAAGVHVIGNADPAAARTPKLAALDREAERAASEPAERVLDALAGICRSHGGNGDVLGDACVHAGTYGTKSSTLLRLGGAPEDDALRYAAGAPCRTQYEDFTPLLHDLRRQSGYVRGATSARSPS